MERKCTYTCEVCSSCRLYNAVERCGKLESFGLQHSFLAGTTLVSLPALPSSLTSLKLSICEAEGALVMGRYKQLKELDLEFTTYPHVLLFDELNCAIMEQRIYALHEVSFESSSSFLCLEWSFLQKLFGP